MDIDEPVWEWAPIAEIGTDGYPTPLGTRDRRADDEEGATPSGVTPGAGEGEAHNSIL